MLMNNSNIGCNCRNNANNYYFKPIFDELEELSYAKKDQNVFHVNILNFIFSRLLKRQIEEESLNKISNPDPQDEYCEASKNSLENEKINK